MVFSHFCDQPIYHYPALSSLHPADGLMAKLVISLLHFVLLFYHYRVIHHSSSSSTSGIADPT